MSLLLKVSLFSRIERDKRIFLRFAILINGITVSIHHYIDKLNSFRSHCFSNISFAIRCCVVCSVCIFLLATNYSNVKFPFSKLHFLLILISFDGCSTQIALWGLDDTSTVLSFNAVWINQYFDTSWFSVWPYLKSISCGVWLACG